MTPQQPAAPATPESDIRSIVAQLQQSGQFDQLSTQQLESILTQLRGAPVTAKALPSGKGVSYQTDDGRQVINNPDPAAMTAGEERQSIAQILAEMKGRLPR